MQHNFINVFTLLVDLELEIFSGTSEYNHLILQMRKATPQRPNELRTAITVAINREMKCNLAPEITKLF